MGFADELKAMNGTEQERIDYTCNRYIKLILGSIKVGASNLARLNKNRMVGYLGDQGIGTPYDFHHVFSDLHGTSFNANDSLSLTKDVFDNKVLSKVKKELINEGFERFELRSEWVNVYYDDITYAGLFQAKTKHIRVFSHEALQVYIDLHW